MAIEFDARITVSNECRSLPMALGPFLVYLYGKYSLNTKQKVIKEDTYYDLKEA